ncbi:MAG TPA: lytic transglycosylase domain-containing protein [Myxococcales bacterium]|jgi:membrane-bound lytic murein transglycosylase D|nr:lytic transglycosylase domain-containing protein [Myxococcales bacterium]
MRLLPLLLLITAACAGVRTVQPAPEPTPQAPPPEAPPAQPPHAPAFELVRNDVVLAQVHKMTATPGARQTLRAGLENRRNHLKAVHAALAAEGVPLGLDAIPLIETGYENLDGGKNGKGLWQFVTNTAAHYGLRVTSEIDERMDPRLATAAAARYLRDLHRELGEWPLVLAAYAQGGSFVRAAIKREKTRDVWELIRRGAVGNYAAKVMAAALLIEDPSTGV